MLEWRLCRASAICSIVCIGVDCGEMVAFVGSRDAVVSLSGSVGFFNSENDGFLASLAAAVGRASGFFLSSAFAEGDFTPFSITAAKVWWSESFSGFEVVGRGGGCGSCAVPYRWGKVCSFCIVVLLMLRPGL